TRPRDGKRRPRRRTGRRPPWTPTTGRRRRNSRSSRRLRRLRRRGASGLLRAAAGGRILARSGLVLEVLEDRVDLPAVAVRIREPELLLERVAAGLALLLLGEDPARPQLGSPVANLVERADANSEMRQCPGR